MERLQNNVTRSQTVDLYMTTEKSLLKSLLKKWNRQLIYFKTLMTRFC